MTAASKLAPLAGLRVLDFTRILAGPFCTMLLGDLGAEIWKIEKPGSGDWTRDWQPPSVHGQSCYFVSINRNKKSLAIDLSKKKGIQLARSLVERCDVLVENFKPGNMQRLGLDYETVAKFAPKAIYCSISGFGQSGPLSAKGGYDVIAAAIGGLLHITGPPDGAPCKPGVAMTDMLCGLYAHGAIMAALMHREKTGRGQHIDCNLLATQLATLVNIGSNYLNANVEGRRWGTAHESIVPYQAFRTQDDRWFVVGAANDEAFRELCQLVEVPDLAQSSLYATNADRVANRETLLHTLSERFCTHPLAYWESTFDHSLLPHGPVNNMAAAFANPQVQHMNMVREVPLANGEKVKVTAPAVKYSELSNDIRSGPPGLGEHTCQVLRETLNLSSEQLESLKAEKIIDY